MADDHSSNAAGTAVEKVAPASAGIASIDDTGLVNPGEPEHRLRVTDLDPKKERLAERRVSGFFFLSIIGSILAVVFYVLFPITEEAPVESVRISTLSLGLAIALGLLGIGIGAVHWAKALMSDVELTEMRHGTRGTEATREKAAAAQDAPAPLPTGEDAPRIRRRTRTRSRTGQSGTNPE